jgi:glycosyltransferase A (GT-A) superfamily protein (DUF2064 family)
VWLAQSGLQVVPLFAQASGMLDARLEASFSHAFATNARVCIIGTDVPDLSTQVLDDALAALDLYSVVLGPAVDGGFYLLALRNLPAVGLLDGVRWSTSHALGDTVARLKARDLSCAPLDTLPTLRDIDTANDLRAWLRADRCAGTEELHRLGAQALIG